MSRRSDTPRARRVMTSNPSALQRLGTPAGKGVQGIVTKGKVNLGDADKAVVIKRGMAKERDIMVHLSAGDDDKLTTHVVSLLHATDPDEDGLCELTISACELGSLEDQRLERFDEANRNLYVFQVLNDVVKGLKHMHEKHVMHLDLKTENIFIDSHGRACIGDFGHSEINPKRCTDESTVMRVEGRVNGVGSPYYIPPEECMEMASGGSAVVDYKSDIWSLGVMLGRLTGQETSLVAYDELQDVTPGPAARSVQTLKVVRSAQAKVSDENFAGWAADSRVSRDMLSVLVKEVKSHKVTQLGPREVSLVLKHLSKWLTAPSELRPTSVGLARVIETLQSVVPTFSLTSPLAVSSAAAGGLFATPASRESAAGVEVRQEDKTSMEAPVTPSAS